MVKKSLIEDIRKKQIIDSAIASIAAYGYVKTTLNQIANEANISKGVITYYFKSKDSLLLAVLNKILKSIKEYIEDRVRNAETPIEKLKEYIFASFDHMIENRRYYEAQVELWSNLEYKKKVNEKLCIECINTVSRLIKEATRDIDSGKIDHETIASLIQATIDGTMIQWVFNEQSVNLENSRDSLWNIIYTFVTKCSEKE